MPPTLPTTEYQPFEAAEFSLLRGFVSGTSVGFDALQKQLDALRYASALFRPPQVLGIGVKRLAISRWAAEIRFRVSWGYGSEDYLLGDRRRFILRDTVLLREDGQYVLSELQIYGGRLQRLVLLGTTEGPGQPVHPPPRSLRGQRVRKVLFCERWSPESQTAPAAFFESRLIENPHPKLMDDDASELTDFQKWLMRLDAERITVSGRLLSLHWRRAQPALGAELDEFEQRHGVRLPRELREFWTISNGGSFFGDTMHGTYDGVVCGAPGNRHLVLLQSMQMEGVAIAVRLRQFGEATDESLIEVTEEDMGLQRTLRRWNSLFVCLGELVNERHAVSQPVV